jgi:hypothetical protein
MLLGNGLVVTFRCNEYTIIEESHLTKLMDVGSYRGTNMESDHYLLGIKLRARISNAKTSTFKK